MLIRIQFETPEQSNKSSPEGGSSPSSFPEGGNKIRSQQPESPQFDVDKLTLQDEGNIPEDFDPTVPEFCVDELEMQQPPYIDKDSVITIPIYPTRSGREVRKPARLIETMEITLNYESDKESKVGQA